MGTAARRARFGSTNTLRRALNAAGVPLVFLSPGVFAVEEADLARFIQHRQDEPPAAPKPKPRPMPADQHGQGQPAAGRPGSRKRRQ